MHDRRCTLDCRDGSVRDQPVGDRDTALELRGSADEGCGSDASADKRVNCRSSDLTRRTGDNWRALFHSVLGRFVVGYGTCARSCLERMTLFKVKQYETASRQKKTRGSTTYNTLRLRASPRPKWAIAADTSVIAKLAYANSFALNGTAGIRSAGTPRILAIVSSILKYGGNPRWTNAPSGPFGKGKWSLKTKLTMLKSITANTSPVLARYNARSRLVSVRLAPVVVMFSSRCRSVMIAKRRWHGEQGLSSHDVLRPASRMIA